MFVTLHQDDNDKTEVTVNTDQIVFMERTGDRTFIRFATSPDGSYKHLTVIEAPHVIANRVNAASSR